MTTLTKEEWIARASSHYVERAGVSTSDAANFAATLHEDFSDDEPESAVDEDLTYWSE
ncbi:hypothetical protein BSFA1_10470 [Burkholderia sp. SFA1]|nr:hypothetical protein BSFA1_10470 [Burkholderia sp. SFA1]